MTQLAVDILGLNTSMPKASDYYVAVDTLDVTQSTIGTTKKYLLADLISLITVQNSSLILPNVQLSSTTNFNATYANGPDILNPGINATLTDASGTFSPLVIDGVPASTSLGNYYLIKNQSNPIQNGIYQLNVNGDGVSVPWMLMRAFYFNSTSNIINGQIVSVIGGDIQIGTLWRVNFTIPLTVGTTGINFTPVSTSYNTLWNTINISSVIMVPNNGYIINNSSLTTLTLPTFIASGQILEISGVSANGWTIQQNAFQQINLINSSTTNGIGGSLSSSNRYDSVKLLCVVDNLIFNVISYTGSLVIV